MKRNRLIAFTVLLCISIGILVVSAGCVSVLLERIERTHRSKEWIIDMLEHNPKVARIISLIIKSELDRLFIISLEMNNGGILTVEVEGNLHSAGVYFIREIGGYCAYTTELSSHTAGKWIYYDFKPPSLVSYVLEYALLISDDTLEEVISAYDDIVAFMEKVYNEPPIPYKDAQTIDDWGYESELKQYTGYITHEYPNSDYKTKIKVYVYRKEESEEVLRRYRAANKKSHSK